MEGTYEAEWGYEEPNSRERFTQAPKGQTESFTIRVYVSNLRVLDEIIHSGVDPRLKTKADCVQDAIAFWIKDWVENYADGISGATIEMLHMDWLKMARDARNNFITRSDEELEEAVREGDSHALRILLGGLEARKNDPMSVDAPQSYHKALENRIDRIKELLRKEIPQ